MASILIINVFFSLDFMQENSELTSPLQNRILHL